MSSRSQRVSNGIDSLVRRLLVEIPGEDAASAEDRELNAVDFVREVLERYIFPSPLVPYRLMFVFSQFQNSCCGRGCQPSLRSNQETIDTNESKSRKSSPIYKSVQQIIINPCHFSEMGSAILSLPAWRPATINPTDPYEPVQKPSQKSRKEDSGGEKHF